MSNFVQNKTSYRILHSSLAIEDVFLDLTRLTINDFCNDFLTIARKKLVFNFV